jgi:hypothetical protein
MVRRRADGSPDFTCMDRYLDLWQKVCGQPKKLTLYLWCVQSNPQGLPKNVDGAVENSVKVTRINADGKLENIPAPYYGTPTAREFWKPVFDGIRERLAKRGWKDTEVLLSEPWDNQPQAEVVAFLKDVAPGWRWRVFAVGANNNIPMPTAEGKLLFPNGIEVGWLEGCGPNLGCAWVPMKRVYPYTIGPRGASLWSWGDAPALSVSKGVQGLSQIGLDFWGLKEERGRGYYNLIRNPGFNWRQDPRREFWANAITFPGPNGAEATGSYEWLHEGMQLAEAFVQVRDHDSRLPEDLRFQATEAAETFDALVHCRMQVPSGRQGGPWNAALRELYRMAGVLQTTTLPPATAPEPAKPIAFYAHEIGGLRLVVPRDGYALSAKASLAGPQLTGISATPPQLTGPGGAVLPAEAVQVRWFKDENTFIPKPMDGKRQDMVLLVHAPKDATPGVYTGSLKVTCQGFEGTLPIHLEIMPYVMPAPKDWPMLTGLIHSPDAIARQYKAEPWSDDHLKYMEPSLRLLRDIGSESCQVFLIADGLLNERYSMVRRRADGTPDFTCMERYLDLWQRVCGQPKYLTLYTWDGNQYKRGAPAYSPENSVLVTRMNADGKPENVRAPYYGTPTAKAFWQPVFDGIRERLAKRGWQNTKVVLGVPWDGEPQDEVIAFLKEVAPDWRWRVYTHGYGKPLPNTEGKLILGCGLEVEWFEGVGPASHLGKWPNMVKGFLMKRLYPFTSGNRGIYPIGNPSTAWRDGPTHDLFYGSQGISQIGLDYWLSLNCWTGLGGNPRDNLVENITTPGPNGAEPSLGYELLREGLQTAAVYKETKDRCADLSKEEKTKALEAVQTFESIIAGRMAWQDPIATSQRRWNAAVRDLYQIAGKVQAATPKGAVMP